MVCVLLVKSDAVDASFSRVSTVSLFVSRLSTFRAYNSRIGTVFCRVSLVFVAVVANQNVGVRLLCHLVRCNSCVESFIPSVNSRVDESLSLHMILKTCV